MPMLKWVSSKSISGDFVGKWESQSWSTVGLHWNIENSNKPIFRKAVVGWRPRYACFPERRPNRAATASALAWGLRSANVWLSLRCGIVKLRVGRKPVKKGMPKLEAHTCPGQALPFGMVKDKYLTGRCLETWTQNAKLGEISAATIGFPPFGQAHSYYQCPTAYFIARWPPTGAVWRSIIIYIFHNWQNVLKDWVFVKILLKHNSKCDIYQCFLEHNLARNMVVFISAIVKSIEEKAMPFCLNQKIRLILFR